MAQYKHPGVYDGDSVQKSSITAKETKTPVPTKAEVQITEDEETTELVEEGTGVWTPPANTSPTATTGPLVSLTNKQQENFNETD